MSDYIEREKALKAVEDIVCDADDAERTCDRIIDIPSTDVAPIRHGRWIYKDEPIFGNPYGRYYCDLCEYGMADKENYCPNCGARMDGENNEND